MEGREAQTAQLKEEKKKERKKERKEVKPFYLALSLEMGVTGRPLQAHAPNPHV